MEEDFKSRSRVKPVKISNGHLIKSKNKIDKFINSRIKILSD